MKEKIKRIFSVLKRPIKILLILFSAIVLSFLVSVLFESINTDFFYEVDMLDEYRWLPEYEVKDDTIVQKIGDYSRVYFDNVDAEVVEIRAGLDGKTTHILITNDDKRYGGYSGLCYTNSKKLSYPFPYEIKDSTEYADMLPPYNWDKNSLNTCRSGYINDLASKKIYYAYAIDSCCTYPNGAVVIEDIVEKKKYVYEFQEESEIAVNQIVSRHYSEIESFEYPVYFSRTQDSIAYPSQIRRIKSGFILQFGKHLFFLEDQGTSLRMKAKVDLVEDLGFQTQGCGIGLDSSMESDIVVVKGSYCEGSTYTHILDFSNDELIIEDIEGMGFGDSYMSQTEIKFVDQFTVDLSRPDVTYLDVDKDYPFEDLCPSGNYDFTDEEFVKSVSEVEEKYESIYSQANGGREVECSLCGWGHGCYLKGEVKEYTYSSNL